MNMPIWILIPLLLVCCLCRAEISTVKLEQESVGISRQFDGVVEAVHSATVSGQTSGRVAEILFDIGDSVPSGAIIVRLVSEDQQGGLQQAQAALADAKAVLKVDKLELDRISALFAKGVIPRAELDRAQGKLQSREAQVKNAEGALRRARQQLDYTVIKAPFAGVVSERHIELGEAVSPGIPIMSGFKPGVMRVMVDIPQDIASQVRREPTVQVFAGSDAVTPQQILVYPQANAVTGTVKVRLELPEGDHGVVPGQWVKVMVVVGEEQQLLIPQSAVLQRSQISNVYVKSEAGYQLRNVRLGKRVADKVAVNAGLLAGETLVLNPLQVMLQEAVQQGDHHE